MCERRDGDAVDYVDEDDDPVDDVNGFEDSNG